MDFKVTDSNETPICPHCEKEITGVLKHSHGEISKHVVYFCENCKKVLSIGFDQYRG